MEIKTAFSSQFNHDAAIKGSGLLNMVFFFFVPGGVYEIKKTQKWHFEVFVFSFYDYYYLHLL